MHQLWHRCPEFWVGVRLRDFNGRWLASADTPDGPPRLGNEPPRALWMALEPFDGVIDELLASLSNELMAYSQES